MWRVSRVFASTPSVHSNNRNFVSCFLYTLITYSYKQLITEKDAMVREKDIMLVEKVSRTFELSQCGVPYKSRASTHSNDQNHVLTVSCSCFLCCTGHKDLAAGEDTQDTRADAERTDRATSGGIAEYKIYRWPDTVTGHKHHTPHPPNTKPNSNS